MKIVIALIAVLLLTGCQSKTVEKNENILEEIEQSGSIIKDQIFTGLEFITLDINGTTISTKIINNTGAIYEPSKFKIVVKNKEGKIIDTIIGSIDQTIKSGETKIITSSSNVDLNDAYRIQYSVN